ncbi:hypothetical protein QAD02_016018 [Eretmocerus hayati]|uniref:Uncharacterized protein n=1 Tax=Eretmocerus hayati TaxID=131215 RepID=A0ACC2PBQ0_9HYME|nr:hypothetical protein QAD02_016018 [Eretmocerus hayati]
MCHYTCLGLQHRRIRGGLCTNNVCFCDWDIPDHPLYYEHTYLSLTSSKNIKDEDSATLSNFILESVSDGSTIDSDSGLPLSTPSEDDREIPGQDVESLQENHPEDPALEPGPSNSRDHLSPNDVTQEVGMIHGGNVYKGGFAPFGGGKVRRWYPTDDQGRPIPWANDIPWNYALESSPASPMENYHGYEYECLYFGDLITYDMCHYGCIGLWHPNVLSGTCLNNVCFCAYDLQNVPTFLSRTYLSLRASHRIRINEDVTISSLIAASRGDDSTQSQASISSSNLVRIPNQITPDREIVAGPSSSADSGVFLSSREDNRYSSEVNCRFGRQIISEKECNIFCLSYGGSTRFKITKGICADDDHCYCIYYRLGLRMRKKLEKLEQEDPNALEMNVIRLSLHERAGHGCDL